MAWQCKAFEILALTIAASTLPPISPLPHWYLTPIHVSWFAPGWYLTQYQPLLHWYFTAIAAFDRLWYTNINVCCNPSIDLCYLTPVSTFAARSYFTPKSTFAPTSDTWPQYHPCSLGIWPQYPLLPSGDTWPQYQPIPCVILDILVFTEEVACADPDICEAVCGNRIGCSNIAYPKLVLELMPSGKPAFYSFTCQIVLLKKDRV